MKPDYAKALKFNPYHGKDGRFTTGGNAVARNPIPPKYKNLEDIPPDKDFSKRFSALRARMDKPFKAYTPGVVESGGNGSGKGIPPKYKNLEDIPADKDFSKRFSDLRARMNKPFEPYTPGEVKPEAPPEVKPEEKPRDLNQEFKDLRKRRNAAYKEREAFPEKQAELRQEYNKLQKELIAQRPEGGHLRTRIIPTSKNVEQRKALHVYMQGFTKNLKNSREKAYAEERIRQMINGEDRPKGMSGKFGLSKQRAIQFEGLIYKIFQAGRAKHNV